uniref:Uncharacterized protein n=1 Tax=Heterorhabditis bacteriophora TaxID=37862 RepID=A0A1I7WF63_HETBA
MITSDYLCSSKIFRSQGSIISNITICLRLLATAWFVVPVEEIIAEYFIDKSRFLKKFYIQYQDIYNHCLQKIHRRPRLQVTKCVECTIDRNSLLNDLLRIPMTNSESASNCGSSLYNFLSSIQIDHQKCKSLIHFFLMNCSTFYFHALLGVTKVGSTKGHYYSINFEKNYDKRVYLFILLPIASLFLRQVLSYEVEFA